ncbi:hypothetical protein L9F63_005695 [Diploptera punctata]|uniref:CST complex subunit STN1 n=1 Tax=Diploptera punctata TaxID=6984 RepID=A0AAD7ZCD0_DIPPU|nr:hypothetical protein L9F63_005695 [Diploptera punctata]
MASSSASAPNKDNGIYQNEILMWINDCLTIPRASDKQEEVYVFADFNVKYVEVIGTIAGIQRLHNSSVRYKVDDGTGSVNVMYYLDRPEIRERYNSCVELKSSLQLLNYMMDKMIKVHEADRTPRNIGEYVHVIGRLYEYHEQRNIKAYYLRVLTQNEVTSMFLKLTRLYQDVYKKK